MKSYKYKLLISFIIFILFIIPFFWLKSGEMDLGGDSSRLYFYDPIRYIFSSTLYGISASSFGLETIHYFNLPFISLLLLLKSIFVSPTILISVFHGFSMSIAFIFCYLIIKELIVGEDPISKLSKTYYAGIFGALLYILSPATIDGWEHVLLPHNQIFLNPLIFYLLLKYFKTTNINYIFVTVLLTFIFSPNFSIISAPAIFAFYPLSILFLVLYSKLIIKRKIILKHFLFGLILFLGVQAFHLLPQVSGIFSYGSAINSTLFSNEGKFDRGLSYFSAIAPSIKASANFLGLPQNRDFGFLVGVFIFFPFIVVCSFILRKKKTILLTAFFFLVAFFFATANITNILLLIYKSFFIIPGFSMFRNFYGQWQFAYIFFYSILFGQALYIVLDKLNKKYAYLLLITLALILIINAKPFIVGELVRRPLWQSNDVAEVFKIDPDYEKLLNFVRFLPADGKILTLPMTDPGYQIVAGVNGGAYMGPSTIAYLAGKKDITGSEEFQGYKDLVLNLIKNRRYQELRRLLGFLNIKYIFYNADPKIYDEFPGFPYLEVREFLPKNQESYKELVKNLQFKEIKNINNKFYVFEMRDDNYLPQIYAAKKTLYFNKPFAEIMVPLYVNPKESRIAVSNSYKFVPVDFPVKFDEMLLDIQNKTSFLSFFINADSSVGFPFAFSAWQTDSLVYPFVVLREKLQLEKLKDIDDTYIETAILIADKRIGELERWGINTPILGNIKSIDILNQSWKNPGLWSALTSKSKYNFWEVGFLRYQREIYDLADKIEKPNKSLYSLVANKEKLKKAVTEDRNRFYIIIEKNEKLSKEKKIYVLKLAVIMFDSIMNRLQSKIPSPDSIPYDLKDLKGGEYEILIEKKSMENIDQSKMQIVFNNKKIYLKDFQQDDNWFRGQSISIKNKEDKVLTILPSQSTNLIFKNEWKSFEEKSSGDGYASLTIKNGGLPNANGLIKDIRDWSPKSYYILSLEYLTYGKNFGLMVYDKDLKKNSNFKKILEVDLRSSGWKSYEAVFASSNDAHLASLQILKSKAGLMDLIEGKGEDSKIEIKNLSIIKVSNPKIVLKKILKSNNQNGSFPKIKFTKINSAKYQIDVKNATSPYTLVFTEAFNSKWRLVDMNPKSDTKSLRGYLSRLFAGIGNMIGSVLRIGETKGNGTINYFRGDVKENYSKNIFLDKDTFNTWGKNEIALDRHFGANGYSNAWYIKPEDVGGKTEYTLILEMTTQKLFYRSLMISILVVIFCTIFLIIHLLRRTSDEK